MAPASVVVAIVETSAFGAANAVVATALAFAPAVASVFVNGPAYGDERRYPLRPPGWVLLGPAALAWAVLVGGPATAVLLLADDRWVIGGVVAVIGTAAASVAARALHGLARRWLVFVPAGVVIHDPITLADPVLLQKPVIASIGPAPQQPDGDRIDLTAGALGLAVELRFTQPTDVFVITRPGRRPTAETAATTRLLVAPTRASAVLADAQSRGLRVS
jgi:hypothetical protein